ncbi:hypothetical protein COT75_00475 [Candidatus Beckwithbacteria bacterium CG10_big_fil_rev_8_21_14_0_10_34_10]|uniref:prephenate dehydratase n=1 Tax=Candidatus Beckwithbacteria bacterium CG10_big_fil_rev_8_21_14_0_10_34_10 TaxID=1974495 RepID=A0A2H0WCM7_9BACT|nr:MAG: hypothetical protein COT75_00475 [Candidatus Beckwithbacteria bacterium CG10_big_fil_rev_8_21_14_0_10_34_10]
MVVPHIKVCYQGIPGAYSQIAIDKYFKRKALAYSKKEFKDLFKSVLEKKSDYAMVPIVNSIIGPIKKNVKLMAKYSLPIKGKVSLYINHCLLVVPAKGVNPSKRLKELRKVYSHPAALAQCYKFFKTHPWLKPIKANDTAGSAKKLAISKDKNTSVIASSKAAKLYKLQIIKKNLAGKNNYTHFLVISRK